MRHPRIKLQHPNTAYHVMTRTCQQVCNLSHADTPGFKQICRTILDQMIQVYCVDLHAWTFMGNHFHLCLTIKKTEMDNHDIQRRYERLQSFNSRARKWHDAFAEQYHQRFSDLSWFMWDLNRRIAIAYNKIHQTKGHFWGDRFKSKIIEDEPAILRVMAYIEQNAVKAKIVNKPSQYQACSTADNLELAVQGKPPLTKPIGWLKEVSANNFAWIYKSFMDWLAYIRFGSEEPTLPKELKPYRHIIADPRVWITSLEKGEPANWAKQGYGSDAFENYINQLGCEARKASV